MTVFRTITVHSADGITTVTLDRPEVLNSFDQTMLDEFSTVWASVRADDDVRVVVLQAAGERAFSTGLDRTSGIDKHDNPWSRGLPSTYLGPKTNGVFKPIVCAVQGMCAGGAFYWVAESDIVICSDDAQFFDPHTSYGMTSPVLTWSLQQRVPYGEALRMSLMGLDERVGAERALAVGLVSEVVSPADLRPRAQQLAARIAAKEPSVVQATVKAAWDSLAPTRGHHADRATHYSAIGNAGTTRQSQGANRAARPEPELR